MSQGTWWSADWWAQGWAAKGEWPWEFTWIPSPLHGQMEGVSLGVSFSEPADDQPAWCSTLDLTARDQTEGVPTGLQVWKQRKLKPALKGRRGKTFFLSNESRVWDALKEWHHAPPARVQNRMPLQCGEATGFTPQWYPHFVLVLLANSCSVKKSFLVVFINHKHSHGNPSC